MGVTLQTLEDSPQLLMPHPFEDASVINVTVGSGAGEGIGDKCHSWCCLETTTKADPARSPDLGGLKPQADHDEVTTDSTGNTEVCGCEACPDE